MICRHVDTRRYSLRNTCNIRTHGIAKDDTPIATTMGHNMEVHQRSYRIRELRITRTAFAKASNNYMKKYPAQKPERNDSCFKSAMNKNKQLKDQQQNSWHEFAPRPSFVGDKVLKYRQIKIK